VLELLRDGPLEILERVIGQPVQVKEKIVEVHAFRPTARASGSPPLGDVGSLQRDRVVDLAGTVRPPSDRADQRRIEPLDRVGSVGGLSAFGGPVHSLGGPVSGDVPSQVPRGTLRGFYAEIGVGRPGGVLELLQGVPGDLLHDRPKAP
jgi:hypothetical protein